MEMRDIRDLLTGRKNEPAPRAPMAPTVPLAAEPPSPQAGVTPAVEAYAKLKNKLHQEILKKVDLASLEDMSEHRLRQEIAALVGHMLAETPAQINELERRMLVRDIQNEMLGLGPLELLMANPPEVLLQGELTAGAPGWGERVMRHPALSRIAGRMRVVTFPERLMYCGGPNLARSAPLLADAWRRIAGST